MANPGGKLAAGESPEELVDLLAFALGFFSFVGAGGEAVSAKVLAQGKQVATQMKPRLEAGLVRLIEPLVERPDAAQIKTAWALARRGGSPADVLVRTGEFTVALAGWLRSRPQVLRDVFAGGRAFGAARRLQNAAAAGSPQSMLAQLSTSAPASRLRLSYKWLEAAAIAVGAEPSSVEKSTVEGESIGPVVDAIRKVQSKIDATPPDSEEAADLNEERSALEHELEVAIETSSTPAVVQQAANAQLSSKPSYGIEQRFGVNDQQAQAVLAEGRIVLAAGAGSGKTKTMVAKIEYAVRDQGYDPEQILATSFTRKAAGELGKRLTARNVHGVRTGTTHSISREIIVNGAPALKGQLDKGVRNADMIFRLAIEQVALSQHGGGGRRYASHDLEAYGGNRGWGGGGGGKSKGWQGGKGGGGGGSPYWKQPAGLWFNIGQRPQDAKGRVLGSRRLRTVVGLWQNSMISPDKAWAEFQNAEKDDPLRYFGAAVYGAYDWLKKNDPNYGPALDLDDWLSKAVEVLETNKPYREAVQRRYRMVIVDEAQDQNMTQHKLFGILGEKADTYAMVGDDKQAIYEFRGAAPQEFVTLPAKGFQLLKLTMNYRSGKSIVDAANKLIAYNEDRQIPMVCDANVDRKGMGEIRALETASHESSASFAADEIETSLQAGAMIPSDFGIMVRNNAEADAFALALMARGIPFRCKRDFFSAPAIKSMIAWMTINVGSPDSAVNDAVTQAHMTPGFFLDKEFAGGLARECPRGQNYLQFLLDDGRPYTGQNSWRNAKMVVPYAAALRDVSEFEGDSETLVRNILELEGPKAKFITSLIDQIDPDDLMDEADSVDVTEEQIREAALAPLQPLFQMARTFKDPAKFMEFVLKMQRANSTTRKDDDTQPDEPAVMIGTVHSWKGLEVKHAYVSMAGGVFPHHSNDEKAIEGDETAFDSERRLAYVALTRGEDSVTVLSPKINYLGREAQPSRFISEACIGWVGETPAAPSDGTEEDPLRKQGSDRGFFSADFGEDLAACLGALQDDDSWLGIYGPDDSDDQDDVLERLYFGLGEEG
jgi:superfamily I DNA/RNA helicase